MHTCQTPQGLSLFSPSVQTPLFLLHFLSKLKVSFLFQVLQHTPQPGKSKESQTNPKVCHKTQVLLQQPNRGRKHRTFKQLLLFHEIFLWGLLQASIVKRAATSGCSLMQWIHNVPFPDSWHSVLILVVWKSCCGRLVIFFLVFIWKRYYRKEVNSTVLQQFLHKSGDWQAAKCLGLLCFVMQTTTMRLNVSWTIK